MLAGLRAIIVPLAIAFRVFGPGMGLVRTNPSPCFNASLPAPLLVQRLGQLDVLIGGDVQCPATTEANLFLDRTSHFAHRPTIAQPVEDFAGNAVANLI